MFNFLCFFTHAYEKKKRNFFYIYLLLYTVKQIYKKNMKKIDDGKTKHHLSNHDTIRFSMNPLECSVIPLL